MLDSVRAGGRALPVGPGSHPSASSYDSKKTKVRETGSRVSATKYLRAINSSMPAAPELHLALLLVQSHPRLINIRLDAPLLRFYLLLALPNRTFFLLLPFRLLLLLVVVDRVRSGVGVYWRRGCCGGGGGLGFEEGGEEFFAEGGGADGVVTGVVLHLALDL